MKIMQSNIAELDMVKDQNGITFYEPPPISHETDFVISEINVVSKGIIYSEPMYLYFVYDDEDYLWISSSKFFNKKSKKVKINPPNRFVEHQYSYGSRDVTLNENISKENEVWILSYYSNGLNKGQVKVYHDKSLSSFILVYDEIFQTIYTESINLYFLDGGKDGDIIFEKSCDVFFSEPERSSYFVYDEENLPYLFRIELMEIQPKTTTIYDFPYIGKPMLVQNTTIENTKLVLHWNLLKNIKEPIHLHQAILTSLQKFFKAGSNKKNQSNSFNTKKTGINADS